MASSSTSLYVPGETTVPYQCTPGPQEEVIATILRKVFAGFSVLGSAFIIATLVQKWRRSPSSIDPYCRIMLGLSIYDIVRSFFPWFLGSWLMPVETGHWGASGNTQTVRNKSHYHTITIDRSAFVMLLSIFSFYIELFLITFVSFFFLSARCKDSSSGWEFQVPNIIKYCYRCTHFSWYHFVGHPVTFIGKWNVGRTVSFWQWHLSWPVSHSFSRATTRNVEPAYRHHSPSGVEIGFFGVMAKRNVYEGVPNSVKPITPFT